LYPEFDEEFSFFVNKDKKASDHCISTIGSRIHEKKEVSRIHEKKAVRRRVSSPLPQGIWER